MTILSEAQHKLDLGKDFTKETGLPFVTISYAQSLDGSIALRPGYPLSISCAESLVLTHTLRAMHDAILVGIGSVLADDPQLTVRLAQGQNPQPLILDSRLRFPPYARLLDCNGRRPWIFTTDNAGMDRERSLEACGAKVFRLPSGPDGRIEVRTLLKHLAKMGILSIMVEGGAEVIKSFLLAEAVNQMVVSISPLLVGGIRAIDAIANVEPTRFPRLNNVCYEKVGNDMVLRADSDWTKE
jgi:GTP cyclohydrolase II